MDKYQETFNTWNKLADLYQEKFMDLDLYNDTYDKFCELVQLPEASLLEIACGPGNITRYLLSARPDFKIHSIDISPNMIDLAQKNNPAATFAVMDCRELDKLNRQYDAIICGFCMPYLSGNDINKLLKDAAALLKKGGIFYGSTIEGVPENSGYETGSSGDRVYVYYHRYDFLKMLLENYGFRVAAVMRKGFTRASGKSETHLIFIAAK